MTTTQLPVQLISGSLAATFTTVGIVDLSSAVSITTTANATVGACHRISGTSANYTITLPTAVGNTGKVMTFIVAGAATATKIYSLTPNGAEVIDTANTSMLLVAYDSVTLVSDGAGWNVLYARLSPPMLIARSSAATVLTGGVTNIPFDTVDYDSHGLLTAATGVITCKRAGVYQINAGITTNGGGALGLYPAAALNVSGPTAAANQTMLLSAMWRMSGSQTATIRALTGGTMSGVNTANWITIMYLGYGT